MSEAYSAQDSEQIDEPAPDSSVKQKRPVTEEAVRAEIFRLTGRYTLMVGDRLCPDPDKGPVQVPAWVDEFLYGHLPTKLPSKIEK